MQMGRHPVREIHYLLIHILSTKQVRDIIRDEGIGTKRERYGDPEKEDGE